MFHIWILEDGTCVCAVSKFARRQSKEAKQKAKEIGYSHIGRAKPLYQRPR
jgi:hypothetical protein